MRVEHRVESLVGGAARECRVGSIVVVVVLPFLELVTEGDVVDDLAFEEPVELLRVDSVGAIDPSLSRGVAGLM